MSKNVFIFCLALFLGFVLPLHSKPLISVSIPPQAYFVKQIANDTVEINILISSGTDEHNFDFKPELMKKLEISDIYFGIGLELEKILLHRFKDLALNLRIVDTGQGLRTHDTHHHEHNSHSDDPHIWLDPILVKAQAETIAQTLIAVYPQNKALYEANLTRFKAQLDALNAQLSSLLAHKKGKKFIVYHPSWAYFAARYDLVQIPVEFEGKEPKPKDLQRLIRTAKQENIRTIFIQKGFPQAMAKNLAKELNANIVEIDHLSEDWHNELIKSAKNIGVE